MKLDRYLIVSKTTSRKFAELVGVSIFAVRKWRQKTRIPRATLIRKIETITNGKVKSKDWYE